jgi:cell division transport system permease protein
VAHTTERTDDVITFVVFSIRRAWQGFWRNAVMSLAATATMVLMLMLLAGFWIIQTGLLAGLEFTEQKVEVVAYLQPNVTESQVTALRGEVEAMPQVDAVVYVTRDDALVRFQESMQAQGREDLTQYLDSNPLYASLEVKLVDPAGIRVVGDALREDPAVRNVINIEDLVDRVLTVTNILRTAGTVLLIVVGVICLFIIVNTIRLAVFARAEEIEIMRLVGASDAFIRWPFVFEGAFVGFLGAVITLAVLAAAAEPLSGFMVEFFRVLPLQVGSLTRDLVALVMGAGVGLGVLGSWVSVRTYLIR